MVDNPDACVPAEVLQLSSCNCSLTALGVACRPPRVGIDMEAVHRRKGNTPVETMVGGGQRLGAAVLGLLGPGGSRARAVEGTRGYTRPAAGSYLTDCSNAFSTVNRTTVLADVAACGPAPTPFVAKCYDGKRPTGVFFRVLSGGHQAPTDRLLRRTAARGTYGAGGDVVLIVATGAEAFLCGFRGEKESNPSGYMDDTTHGLTGVMAIMPHQILGEGWIAKICIDSVSDTSVRYITLQWSSRAPVTLQWGSRAPGGAWTF